MSASPPESTTVSKTASAPPPQGVAGGKGRPPPPAGRKNPVAPPGSGGEAPPPSNSGKKPPTPATRPSPGPTPTSATPRGNNDDGGVSMNRRTPPPPPPKAAGGKGPVPAGVKGANPPPKRSSAGNDDNISETGSTMSNRPSPPPKGKGVKSAGPPPPKKADGSPRASPGPSPRADDAASSRQPPPKPSAKAPMPKPAPQQQSTTSRSDNDDTHPTDSNSQQQASGVYQDDQRSTTTGQEGSNVTAAASPQDGGDSQRSSSQQPVGQQQPQEASPKENPLKQEERNQRGGVKKDNQPSSTSTMDQRANDGQPDHQAQTLPARSQPPPASQGQGDQQQQETKAGVSSRDEGGPAAMAGGSQSQQKEGSVFQPAQTVQHQPAEQNSSSAEKGQRNSSISDQNKDDHSKAAEANGTPNGGQSDSRANSPPEPRPEARNPQPYRPPQRASEGSAAEAPSSDQQPSGSSGDDAEPSRPASSPAKKMPGKAAPPPKTSATELSQREKDDASMSHPPTTSDEKQQQEQATPSPARIRNRAESEEMGTQTPISPTRHREEESRAETEKLKAKIAQVESELAALREEKETWQRKSEVQQQADSDAFVDHATQMSAEHSKPTASPSSVSQSQVAAHNQPEEVQQYSHLHSHHPEEENNATGGYRPSTMMMRPQSESSPTPAEPRPMGDNQGQLLGTRNDFATASSPAVATPQISTNASSHATYYYLRRMEEMRRVTDLASTSETPTSHSGGDGMNSTPLRERSPQLTGPSPSSSSRLPPPPETSPLPTQQQLTFTANGVPKRDVLTPHAFYTGGGVKQEGQQSIVAAAVDPSLDQYDSSRIRPVEVGTDGEKDREPVYHTLSAGSSTYFSGGTHYHLGGGNLTGNGLVPAPGEGMMTNGSTSPPEYYDYDQPAAEAPENTERVVVEGGQVHRIFASGDIPARQAAQEVLWVPSSETHTRDERQKYSNDPLRTRKVLQGFFQGQPQQRTTSPLRSAVHAVYPVTDPSSPSAGSTTRAPGSAYNVAATMLEGQDEEGGRRYSPSRYHSASSSSYSPSATTAYYTPGGSQRVPNVTSSYHRDPNSSQQASHYNENIGYSRNMASFRSPRVRY